MGASSIAQAPEGRCPPARSRPWTRPPRSGPQRLDPEVLGSYLGRLLRTASALCDSREDAEDLVQETIARILARPRWLRGENESAYLTQALRNTFLTNTRSADRRPRAIATLEELDPADRRTDTRPEEAMITGQVFPAIARLPESFRLGSSRSRYRRPLLRRGSASLGCAGGDDHDEALSRSPAGRTRP